MSGVCEAVAAQLAADGGPRPLAATLGLAPGDLDALLRFAERDLARGRARDAVETLRVAAVLDPRRADVFAALGRAYRQTGEASRAASAARVADAIARLGGAR